MHMYRNTLEPVAVPSTECLPKRKSGFRRLLAHVRWRVNHVWPPCACSASKTVRKHEDERSAFDVRDLDKLVPKVKISNAVAIV